MFCERQRDSRPPPRSLIRSPPTSTVPPVGESRPPIRLSSVVLPEPEGPISARKSPDGMVTSTPLSTSMRSLPRVKYLRTSAIRTSASLISLLRSSLATLHRDLFTTGQGGGIRHDHL